MADLELLVEAARIAGRNVKREGVSARLAWQQRADRWLTHPVTAFPIMIAVLGVVLWLTIAGANAPSSLLATLLVDQGHPAFVGLQLSGDTNAHCPSFAQGLTIP